MRYIVEPGPNIDQWYVYDKYNSTWVGGPSSSLGQAELRCDRLNEEEE